MSYPLRLPEALDVEARERCKRLGISLNALIAVALDEYLHRAGGAAAVSAQVGSRRGAAKRASKAGSRSAKPVAIGDDWQERELEQLGEANRWKFFDPDPDLWPLVDPDPAWQLEASKFEDTPEGVRAMEAAYWATRERPPYP